MTDDQQQATVDNTTVGRSVSIRLATALDAVNIVKLLKLGREEEASAGNWQSRVNDTRAVDHVLKMIDKGVVVVADKSGRLVGTIGSIPDREEWAEPDDWFVNCRWFYVLPQYRDKGVAHGLLAMVERFCIKNRLPLYIGVMSATASLAKGKYLEMRGFQHAGGNYVRLPDGQQKDHDELHREREGHADDSAVA